MINEGKLSWSFSFAGKAKDILPAVKELANVQRLNRSEIEQHQITAAVALVKTVCDDLPNTPLTIRMHGNHYDGKVSLGGSISVLVTYLQNKDDSS